MGMQQNAWMTRWLFESWISHFLEYLKSGPGIDHSKRHLLILDGHNSHVTLEVVKISMQFGLDIVSLPSHTSHALQPLDVACFKPFKTAFRRCRDLWSLENSKKEVGKQDLCEWTSRALQAALTPNNIKAGFRSTRIWLLDRTATTGKMHATAGFKVDVDPTDAGQGEGGMTGPAGNPSAATGEGQDEAGHRGPDTGLAGTGAHAPHAGWAVDVGPASTGAESDAAAADSETDVDDDDAMAPAHLSSTAVDAHEQAPHYYVDVADAHESTYDACDRNVAIDADFDAQLRQEREHDITTFLALPELIPARKRKRQQPLLDFTRSKILTSQAYTEGCERLLAQRGAYQEQAKRKAANREVTKEQRRKEKEAKDLQVQARKDARAAKKLETERLQAERRARREGGRQDRGCASEGGRTSVPGDEAHMLPAPQVHTTPQAAMMWPPASGGSSFFLNPALMMAPHFTQPFQRSHDLNGHPWIT